MKTLCLGLAASLLACASVNIVSPANGKSGLALPQLLQVTTSGPVSTPDVKIDSVDFGQRDETIGQYLFFLAAGSHTIVCSATASGNVWPSNPSGTSTFSIASCPLCTQCPNGGTQDPFYGTCCSGGACDSSLSSNFGPAVYLAGCNNDPASVANDCINANGAALCGASAGNACSNMGAATAAFAVSFKNGSAAAMRLQQIQLPLGHRAGTNAYNVWIATDDHGAPGASLEEFRLTSIRAQPGTTGLSPLHILSNTHPSLAAGTTYWLVVAPGARDTVGTWNSALSDIATAANFAQNNTGGASGAPGLSGPWNPLPGPPRPAFEIDAR
jgi:hypothetical protein